MPKTVIELDEREIMMLESILMDQDNEEALNFLKEIIKPKLRAKGTSGLDSGKSIGIMT